MKLLATTSTSLLLVLAAIAANAVAANAQIRQPAGNAAPVSLPHQLILKVRGSDLPPAEFAARVLSPVTERYGIGGIASWLNPNLLAPGGDGGALHKQAIDAGTLGALSRILVVRYSSGDAPEAVVAKLRALPGVEYAEPVYRRSLDYMPNDPDISQQWYLEQIKAFDAWNIARADSSIIIAITDTGVDAEHPDLKQSVWQNRGEEGTDSKGHDRRTNGLDDDNNGFVDDWIGYDFGGTDGYTPDNNPTPFYWHGTHVAGIAAATGDNHTGIVGVGFGARIMIVKISDDDASGDPLITKGYDGILYAAKMGAKIINCSWGGPGYSQAEQELINTVIQKGCLIVAAAGNNGGNVTSYPASYRGVLSVASVVGTDQRSSFSNFNSSVGISAPGEEIYSTAPITNGSGTGYRTSSGTSMASPVIAGAAALVALKYPERTPEQIAAVLRANSDKIDSVNPGSQYLLGSGRINVLNALANGPNAIEVDIVDYHAVGDVDDSVLNPGEMIELRVHLKNLLRQVDDLKLQLSSSATNIAIATPIDQIGTVATGADIQTHTGAFRLQIPNNIPLDYVMPLQLTVFDGTKAIATRRVEVVVNPNYATTAHNRTAVTFTGDGKIGFNDFPTNEQGHGFRIDSSDNLLAEGGMLIGTGPGHLADVIRSGDLYHENQGFQTVEPYRLQTPIVAGAQVGTARFNDARLPDMQRIGVDVSLKTLQYGTPESERQTLLLYTIHNNTQATLTDLHCALFLDWDIGTAGSFDKTRTDPEHRMGYTMNTRNTKLPMAAAMLVSNQPMNFQAFDNGSAPLANGFYQAEKWAAMTGGIKREESGVGDCSFMIGAGPIDLAPGADTVIAFALIAGSNLSDLKTMADDAGRTFAALGGTPGGPIILPSDLAISEPTPNPFTTYVDFEFSMPQDGLATVDVYNTLGDRIETLASGNFNRGTHQIRFAPNGSASGIYFIRVSAFDQTFARKVIQIAP